MHVLTMMTRKEFLRSIAGLGAGALAVGCSDGGSPKPNVDAPPQNMIDAPKPPIDAPASTIDAPMTVCPTPSSIISSNHGHVATIPSADVQAGVQKSYDIQGASDHPHTITVTAAMFMMMKAGQTVNVVSTNDAAHTHTVMLSCS
jgi:hypothetical protein